MAAVLWGGPDASVSHRAAARVWGLVEDAPAEIVARVGRDRPGLIVHRLRPHDRPARRTVDGLPVTSPERTLLDLAGVTPVSGAGVALDEALRQGLTTLRKLRYALEREGGSGRKGTASLRRLLEVRDEADERMESVLERRLFRLLRRAGVPLPSPQYEVRSGRRLVARLDFAYPELRVGIETHGYRWHGGYQRWQRDIRRENVLKRLGWLVLVFTWDDVRSDAVRVAAEVRSALDSREVLPKTPLSTSKMGEPRRGART